MDFTFSKPNKPRDIGIIFLVVLGALLFRRWDAFTNPQLWAEDCPIFFQQMEELGIKSLITPYGGYLHMVPRLIALLFSTLHVNYLYIPVCYNYSAFLLTFLIALNIWTTSSYLGIKHRILYATCFLFLPLASDIFMNITNINWFTSLYLVNFLFVRYTDHTDKNWYLNLIALVVVSLSGPFSAILCPLVIVILILERKKLSVKKFIPLGLILICGAIQFICIRFIDPNFYRGTPGAPEQLHLLKLFTNNMSELLFMQYQFMQWLSPFKMIIISLLVFLVLLYNFIVDYYKIDNTRRYILIWSAIILLCAYIKAYWPNESRVLALDNARYYFIPYTCIAWLVIIANDKKIKPVYIVIYLVFFVSQHRYTKEILPDKQWKKQILEYYEGKRDVININPDDWHFTMPKRK